MQIAGVSVVGVGGSVAGLGVVGSVGFGVGVEISYEKKRRKIMDLLLRKIMNLKKIIHFCHTRPNKTLISVRRGYFDPQAPWKSSVSTDQTMIPPKFLV